MKWLTRVRRRFGALLRRAAWDRDMDEEMRLHVELEAEHLVRVAGVEPAEARRRAAIAFGGVERYRESGRDARGVRALEELARDVRHGARALVRSPGVALPAVLTLGLGIGVTTAMFSIVHGVLLRPLPFLSPERLVSIWEVQDSSAAAARAIGRQGDVRVSLPTYTEWSTRQAAVAVTGFTEREYVLTGADARVLQGAAVSPTFFELLGVPLQLGRSFAAGENEAGAPGAVVLGHALWQSHFAGDRAVLGRTVELHGRAYEVVGVASAGFDFPAGSELWTPLRQGIARDLADLPQLKIVSVLGRLAPGVTVARATAELSAIAAAVPGNEGWSASVVPLHDELTAPVRSPLWLLLGSVLLVLLIACANVGHLLLARGAARRQELSIRSALGAGRLRIARALLTEGMLLALAACLLGVLIAYGARDLLLWLTPVELPAHARLTIDGRVLAFALLVSLLTGLLAGGTPALRLGSAQLAVGLGESGAQRTHSRAATRLRAGLVVAEVALSLVLLAASGLLIRSFVAIVNVDPGFDADQVTAFELRMPQHRYRGWAEPVQARARLIERVEALPGIQAASVTQALPLTGPTEPTPIQIEGRERDDALPTAAIAIVAPGYFDAMGIRLRAGRDFEDADAERALVAIVNETFARTYFPGEDPIGKKAARLIGGSTMREIVGVVADVRQTDLTTPPQPIYYTHAAQEGFSALTLVVRSSLPAATLVPAVRTLLGEVDAEIAVAQVATMRDLIGRSVAQPRFYAVVLGAFAALAMVLAALGLYSMLSEQAAERRQELGIRLALGARPADVLLLLVGAGMRLTALGIALGAAGALLASRLLRALLFGVGPTDAGTYFAGIVLLLAAALLATLVPAARAARLDPVRSLRP